MVKSSPALLSPEGVELLVRLAARAHRPEDSVADPGCLCRIPDPDFYPSRIPKQQQKRGVKKKLLSFLSFEKLKKKIRVNFQRIV